MLVLWIDYVKLNISLKLISLVPFYSFKMWLEDFKLYIWLTFYFYWTALT